MVSQAREAITLDTVQRALAVEAIGDILVVTDSASLAESLRRKPVHVELEAPGEKFHFGRRLREVIAERGIEKVFYMGGGSGALLSVEDIGYIAETILSADGLVIANNFYSTDFAAFTPAQAIESIEPPVVDNDLAWLLVEQAGLPCRELPRNAATQLDVDTPVDLMTLKVHPGVGPHTRRYLDGLELDTSHIEEALGFLTDRDAEVMVAGRVSATTWAYLERETACRVRLFAEERGMRASGRQARGEAMSLLGFYLDEVGVDRFFATLAEMSQAAFTAGLFSPTGESGPPPPTVSTPTCASRRKSAIRGCVASPRRPSKPLSRLSWAVTPWSPADYMPWWRQPGPGERICRGTWKH